MRGVLRTLRVAAVAGVLLSLAGCAGDQDATPVTAPTTTPPATLAPPTTAPPPTMMTEVLGFIEVSVRIGVGDGAEVVSLAVDETTLQELELREPPAALAWCSGVGVDPADTERVDGFVVLMRGAAIDVTAGGAQSFELLATEARLGDDPVPVEIVVVADGRRHEVADGLLELGDSFTSGTFRGLSARGVLIEGAFLCG